MPEPRRIYLDNAATSFPKPDSVHQAVDHYSRQLGAAVGRGGYREALQTGDLVDQARKRLAELLHAEDPSRLIWTFNGTDGLNIAIRGFLQPGDHVVTSVMEHNSVLRPLRELEVNDRVEVSRLPVDADGRISPSAVEAAIRPNTRLIALIHASNVTGTLQPVHEVGRLARRRGIAFLVDAAQSAGHYPIDLRDLHADMLAFPGHKGLLGPLGTGALYLRPGIEDKIRSQKQGGTGSVSERDLQPDCLPDKFESGNHNAPGLVGLGAALAYIQEKTQAALARHERELTARFLEGLAEIPGVNVFGPKQVENRLGVISLTVDGYDPQVLAALLDGHYRIQIRAGLHCAPLAHRSLGTLDSGGTARFSVGPFNTTDDIDAALAALREVAEAADSME